MSTQNKTRRYSLPLVTAPASYTSRSDRVLRPRQERSLLADVYQ
ncbi:hypothetical protein [Anabaena azotica]|nr:hypothetical protein [Anabaena azotica]